MRDLTKLKKPKATRMLGGALGLLLVLTLVLVSSPVSATPQMGHIFFGDVTSAGQPVAEGTSVVAKIGSVVYASTTVDADSRYGWVTSFEVPADDPGTPEKEGGVNGETIDFYVAGELVDTYVFEIGGRDEFDLAVVGEDTTDPTVVISTTASDPTNTSPIPVTATFSETVTGFVVGDINVSNGAAGNFVAVSGAVYTFDVTPVAAGAVTVDIAAGVAQDAATNPNEAATQFSIIYSINPTVVISSTASDPTSTSPIPVTATFSEIVTGFVVGDITVGNGAAGNFVAVSGAVYTFDVTPAAAGEVTVDIAAGVATDAATNPNEAATQFSIIYSINPTVVISTTASDPTDISPIPMTATFSETVTGFELSDITVENGAAGNFAGSGAVYTFDVTPVAEGAVTVDIAAGVAQDAATNPNEAATQFSIIYSTETFTITATAGDNGTISPSGDVVVNSGASQAFTITPNTGYVVDDVLVDGISVGAVSSYTFANVTADHTIHATFAVVVGDLGDEIADTESGGTVQLLTGTYTGDVIIDKPITIRGSEEGTTISGGIHVAPLTGSDVTIENLTITDYTDYGIWIELVGADDVFIIRNNTIEGVEGSVVGIKVDEVEAGGSLTIRENSISGNEVGIKLMENVADATIHFNDITGNTVYGLEQLAVVSNASAICNWWADISGPEYEAASFEDWSNPGGLGDAVSDNVDFIPWLTRDFQTVLDDNIAYYGYSMVWLYTGWNIISTPIALDPVVEWEDSDGIARTGVQTWGEYVDLGDGLAIDTEATTYCFDGEIQDYVQVLGTYRLKPCDAIYVKMAEDDVAAILLSPSVSVPSKELYAGWNLVSLAWLPTSMEDMYGLPADEALITVEEVAGGLNGYKLVVSPAVNAYEPPWIYIAGDSIESWTDPELPQPDGWMWITSGYWVFMLNDGTLAGFTFTPVSLGM